MKLDLSFDTKQFYQALLKAPDKLEREIDISLDRILWRMARDARDNTPKATSLLTNSIHVERPTKTEGLVVPGVDYAQLVEKGTGSYATDGGGFNSYSLPPIEHIHDWIIAAGITPNNPEYDEFDLAWAIAQSIAVNGTPAQPFMEPAFYNNQEYADRELPAAIERALQ